MEKGKVANCFYFVTMESSDKIKYHILSSKKNPNVLPSLQNYGENHLNLMLVLLSKKYY